MHPAHMTRHPHHAITHLTSAHDTQVNFLSHWLMAHALVGEQRLRRAGAAHTAREREEREVRHTLCLPYLALRDASLLVGLACWFCMHAVLLVHVHAGRRAARSTAYLSNHGACMKQNGTKLAPFTQRSRVSSLCLGLLGFIEVACRLCPCAICLWPTAVPDASCLRAARPLCLTCGSQAEQWARESGGWGLHPGGTRVVMLTSLTHHAGVLNWHDMQVWEGEGEHAHVLWAEF